MRIQTLLAFALSFTLSADLLAAELELASRIEAATGTAKQNPFCKGLGQFYWELGDESAVLASGKLGRRFNKDSVFQLASASKLPFATYVLERVQTPSPDQIQKMQMSAGYSSFKPAWCLFTKTVSDCFSIYSNGKLSEAKVGYFYYSDGHDNKLAIDLGLGGMNSQELSTELRSVLGADSSFTYAFPDAVGGLTATPAGYGGFLRKLLAGKFVMSNYLGSYPICTRRYVCKTSARSPIKKNWHYSLNHWIEDDADGDGAFSSVGLYGFYPWISADKKYYGILATQGIPELAGPLARHCGALIRKSWMTGQVYKEDGS